MKRDLAETLREKQTLVKRGERDDLSNRLKVEKMNQERQDLATQLAKSNEDVSILAEQTSQVCACRFIRLASSLFCPYSHSDKVKGGARSSKSIGEGVRTTRGSGYKGSKDKK